MSKNSLQQQLGGIGNAFSDYNFRIYSIGAIATWIGFFVQLVAVSWHAWELTHSTSWLAIIALLDIVPNTESIYMDIKAGVSYIFNHKGISSILIILLVGDALAASIFYMAPAFSEQILGLGVVGVSIILASKGMGAAIAAFWIAYDGEKMATVERMLWGFLFFIIAVFVIFLFRNLYITIIAFVILGMAAETYHTIMTAIVQLSVLEQQRGRVMGTLFMFAQFASGIGTYLIGYYALKHGLVKPTLVVATICFFVWLIYFINRDQISHKF